MPSTIGYPAKQVRASQKNLDRVARAKTLVGDAKGKRTSRETAWKDSERLWRGSHWGEQAAGSSGDLVTVNMSFSTVNTIVPYVTGAEPNFIVEPYSGEATVPHARLLQAMLNRMWRSSRLAGNSHLRRAAWDYLIYGDGFLKPSYTIDKVFKEGSVQEAEIANLWVDRISPYDVWIDPSSDGMYNARWVVIRLFRSVAQLKADKRFSNTSNLASSGEMESGDTSDRERPIQDTGDDKDALVAVYEFYDIIHRELVTYTDQSDLPLQVVEDITCPLVQLTNYMIPHSPYGMGELEQLRWLQQELNKTRSQMIEHRRRNAQKWLVRRGALDQAARAALQSQEVNSVVEVEGNQTLDDIAKPLDVPNLAADAYAIDRLIKGDIYEISGVNEYLRGATPEIRRTATEATIIEGASNVKTAHKLRQIEGAAREVGQLLLSMATDVFPTTSAEEMTLILTGREAQAAAMMEQRRDPGAPSPDEVEDFRLEPSGDLFSGVYEVFVEQGSTELRNPVMREQKYREMVETLVALMPVLMQAGVPVNLRKALEMWYEAAGIDDIDAMFEAPPPPPEEGMSEEGMPGEGMPPGPGGEEIPPELLAILQQMGAGGGGGEAPHPPSDMIDPENSGMMPPIS